MRSRWIPFTSNKPNVSTTAVLQSGTDELVMDDRNDGSVIQFVCPGVRHNKIRLDKHTYDLLGSEGYHLGPAGSPMIPTTGQFVAIPYHCKPQRVEIVELAFDVLDGRYSLPPHGTNVTEEQKIEYVPDRAIYSRDSYYPETWVIDLGARTVADVKAQHIVIYKMKYNPVSKRIIALYDITLRVVYNAKEGETIWDPCLERRVDSLKRTRKARPSVATSMVLDAANVLHIDNKRGGFI